MIVKTINHWPKCWTKDLNNTNNQKVKCSRTFRRLYSWHNRIPNQLPCQRPFSQFSLVMTSYDKNSKRRDGILSIAAHDITKGKAFFTCHGDQTISAAPFTLWPAMTSSQRDSPAAEWAHAVFNNWFCVALSAQHSTMTDGHNRVWHQHNKIIRGVSQWTSSIVTPES